FQEVSTNTLLLCWECVSILRRILKFKIQVRKAQDYLLRQMAPQAISLSNLRISENTTTYQYEYTEPTILAFVKVEDGAFDFGQDEAYDDVSDNNEAAETVIKPDVFEIDITETDIIKTKTGKLKVIGECFNESDDEPLALKKKEVKPRGRRKKKTEEVQCTISTAQNKQEKLTEAQKQLDPKGPKQSYREKPPGVVQNARVSRKLQQLNVAPDQLEMIVLSWEEVEAERQRALASETFTRHDYRCHDCALGFNHRCKLDDHMRKHDPAFGTSECDVCRVRCRDSRALAAHKRRHRVRWRCVSCGGTWSRAAVAADHAAREHGAPAPRHACAVCGHTETTIGKLRHHLKSHSERQKCELCGKTFSDRPSLRTHMFIHKGEKEYACHRCDKRFLFKRAMEIHLVTHDASAQLYCYQCDMNFKNRISYNQHMKYTLKHIDPAKLKYACQLCDKKFAKPTRLEEHNLAVHLKMTPIQCTVAGCNFACSSRPVLRTHIRMLHRDARSRRNHVCDVCGKAYTTKKTLEGHLRSHSGERPFRCGRCPSAFSHEATLYNHTRMVHLRGKTIRGRGSNVPTMETEIEAPSTHTWPLNVPTVSINTH
ncbi:uncharacterized protein, partial [Epargyreus clarus]|uniref:uncharacterized protein n=1 Tax=Epargyreus clarus TaxID=520877 RepID=UPI003C2E5C21